MQAHYDIGQQKFNRLLSPDAEIIQSTFEVDSNENVATVLKYNWLQLWTRDLWGKQDSYTNPSQGTALNASATPIQKDIDLFFVRDSTTATAVVTAYGQLYVEDLEWVQFGVTPDKATVIDLNSIVGITHWQGIGSSGYNNIAARIMVLALTPTEVSLALNIVRS